MRRGFGQQIKRATGFSLLLLLGIGGANAALLDVDSDGTVEAQTDGTLILRHLFGFQGTALTEGALSAAATRDASAIQGYLNDLGDYLDVDADGARDALTDGVLILRRLLGRDGLALTQGAVSPNARRDTDAIVEWIDGGRTTPGEAPEHVQLVAASSFSGDEIRLDWLATFDNDTPGREILYRLHAGTEPGFVPDDLTVGAEVTDAVSGTIVGLQAATTYFVKVEAQDSGGHSSWSNELEVVTAAQTPLETATPRSVLDSTVAPGQTVGPNQIVYQLPPGEEAPRAGDLLISPEGNGYLRLAAAVTQNADEVTVQTEPAALNEVFENLQLSTEIKLIDLPQTQSGALARSLDIGVPDQPSTDTRRIDWPESGLTLIQRQTESPDSSAALPASLSQSAAGPAAATSDGVIVCDGVTGVRVSRFDGPLEVTFPETVCVEPGSALSIDVSAHLGGEYTAQAYRNHRGLGARGRSGPSVTH